MKKIILANKIFFLGNYSPLYDNHNKSLDLYDIKDLFSRKNFNCYYVVHLNLRQYENRIFEIEKLDKPFEYISPYDTIHIIKYKITKIFSIEEQKEYLKNYYPELLI
jgi:hypothetical protein